ncbi:hypothetical protein PC129_g12819 [Phytophthora cactorum]|uniref:RRM domain-containing protein n=1 Tax=Phytophthora cactorum TaxID=29920 RepID=A0A8T0YRT2_9STRA|nr:hypothetical protein PC112_g16006 [Phytophthora cactorum]KAG2813798.1 hypothetical protein PC111_g14239 [Phytophthora cactorum]KAG2852106.1 hypothetical protein PC113_g15315 [Phytophthora cactorum]KAG2891646.1 hypothetical protein PC114_g16933 [Phytophthora cactorum]KAG2904728.1 hypothetical protein PC115_g14859 [Phytophthora cactorum]
MGGEEQALAATEEACRVYVGNLLPKAKEIHLTSKFARFGTIHSVWIARRPPGFAFVRFANPDAAQRAVDTCREGGAMEILGKAVRVQMAGDKDRKSAEQQQAINSKHTAKERDLNAAESGNHNRRSRSRSSSRGERSEDSRGGSHKRVRHRSSSERLRDVQGQGRDRSLEGEVGPDPDGETRIAAEVEVGAVKGSSE